MGLEIFGDFYKGLDGRRNHDSLRFKTDRSYKDLVNLLTVSTCFDRVEKVVQEKCWDQWMERSTSWSSAGSLWPWAMNVIEMTTAQAVLKRTKKRCRGADRGHILSCWDLLSVFCMIHFFSASEGLSVTFEQSTFYLLQECTARSRQNMQKQSKTHEHLWLCQDHMICWILTVTPH